MLSGAPGTVGVLVQVGVEGTETARLRMLVWAEGLGTMNGPSEKVTFGLANERVPLPTFVP